MNQLGKKEVIQAVLIADNFNNNFKPITDTINFGLLPLVNTPLLDYTLESLNRSGIEEVFVFCSNHIEQIKEHIKKRIASKCSWSVEMQVNVIGSERCISLGDALRDIDAKGALRGHFILLGAGSITNAQLLNILDQHKQNCKFDKGTAMTVVYKKIAPGVRTVDEIVIGYDTDSKRLLFHQRIKALQKESKFLFPVDIFMQNSKVELRHDLLDPQIAVCSSSVLPLFTDNFDFEDLDDFIRGLLIDEEILTSTIYVSELPPQQYAANVSNWQTYQMISNDIINRWVYPLVPDMGICTLKENYIFFINYIYRNKNVTLARNVIFKEGVVIQERCSVDIDSTLMNCVIGRQCKIGKNCSIKHAYIMDNTIIGDGCTIEYSIIGRNVAIANECKIVDGTVIGDNSKIPNGQLIAKKSIQSHPSENCNTELTISKNAYIIPEDDFSESMLKNTTGSEDDTDSDSDDLNDKCNGIIRMGELHYNDLSSVYSSNSDDEEDMKQVIILEDSNIFLDEVIDSLTRGFAEKTNPEFLILEINSSRYAYNMSLTEVNYYVVKAILSLNPIKNAGTNVLSGLKQLLEHLEGVFIKYIRGESAMRDCLKAIEDSCSQDDNLRGKIAQIIHYLYDRELISEDAIIKWHTEIVDEDREDSDWIKNSMSKLMEWLMESSEEESSENDDD